ncbi:MAG: hypothetical protein Q8N28_03230 [bacterium]|nr:hypothetical protein [bacterium]
MEPANGRGENLVRIRIKDAPETRCCPKLHKFIGMTRNAIATPAGLYVFYFTASNGNGFGGIITEPHQIASHLVEVLS